MPPATASTRRHGQPHGDRRLIGGILVSVLLHGLLLSLQFGVPGSDAGGGAINVTLAPVSSPDLVAATPLAIAPPAPAASLPTPPVPVPPSLSAVPEPVRGMRLVDPLPPPPLVASVTASARSTPRRPRPAAPRRRLREVPTPVIATAPDPESTFAVAVPLPDVEPDSAPLVAEVDAAPIEPVAGSTPDEAEEKIDAGVDQAAQDALARIAADEERQLALNRQQEQARLAQAQAQAQREAADAEARRLAEQQAQAQALAQARRADEEGARIAREREAVRLQAQAVREQEALAAQRERQAQAEREQAEREQADRELAERERRARELDEQRVVQEAAERQRIDALVQRRLLDERARQQAMERTRLDAQQQARGAAEEAARQAAAQRLQAQGPAAGSAPAASPAGAGGVGGGTGPGSGPGAQAGPGAMAGLPGNRARELLRGVTIPNVSVPGPAFERQANSRRMLADGRERDVPVRLYVDSVRQKLERNAVLGGARLSLQDVRIDPLVSVSLRSDGSIDEVTIVRSSGRPDMDEAVRRFVHLNARYAAFPPNVAAQVDVIEIRRIWRFADGLKLIEEMR